MKYVVFKEYWNEVFADLIEDYRAGLTPNPDILCNSRLKFTHFHDYALNKIGCDAIATGHYARNSYGENLEFKSEKPAFLLKSIDRSKDQTFFLSQMPQNALRNTIFPVGELTKERLSGFRNILKVFLILKTYEEKNANGILTCKIITHLFDILLELNLYISFQN